MEVRVPDIGEFTNVPVIEVLVKPGDRIKKEDPLITLESEKASMEVPAPSEGVIKELRVKVGDRVSQGSEILVLDSASETQFAAQAAPQEQAPPNQEQTSEEVDTEESSEVMEAPDAPPDAPLAPTPSERVVELRVPDIGDFHDVPVIEVMIKPGDRIERESSLVALESEKATMEVPATSAGTIKDVALKVGDKVAKGALIATVLSPDATTVPTSSLSSTQSVSSSPSVTPSLSTGRVDNADATGNAAENGGTEAARSNGEVHASPSIRRFARELGVNLGAIAASGPNGRITRDDIQNFVKRSLKEGASQAAPTNGMHLAPWPKIDFAQYGPVEVTPLSRIKKISGLNLHRNWVMIPHVTNNDDADITKLESFRQKLNAERAKTGGKVTILAFLIKAAVAALKTYPDFNASLEGDTLVRKKYYNVGFAADTPGGLMVPVLKGADKKGVLEIARETAELAAKAREGKLPLSDMQGGTFTISSLGGIGGTYFTPIINAPEVAILGVCHSEMKPVWNGKKFKPRLVLPLSLSYDHRVIDGAAAARFNVTLSEVLGDMRRAML